MGQADKLYQVVAAEVGYHEGRNSNGSWNNIQKYSPAVPGLEWSQGMAWCCTFMSWGYQAAGLKSLGPVSADCAEAYQWFANRGRVSGYPATGAQVFFGPGGGSHTGFVYAYDKDYIYTVEGNTNTAGSAQGDGVYVQKRARRDDYVYAYGLPKYTDPVKSADPNIRLSGVAYAATATLTKTTTTPPPTTPAELPWVSFRQIAAAAAASNGVATVDGDSTKDDVLNYQKGLKKLYPSYDYSSGPGVFGPATHAQTRTFQLAQGWNGAEADGNPGPSTVTLIGSKSGLFRVRDFGETSQPPVTPPPPATAYVASVAINAKTGVSFARYVGGGNVDQWISAALDARGITGATARANWTRGYKTLTLRESAYDPNAANFYDSNAITPAGYTAPRDYGNAGVFGPAQNGTVRPYQASRGIAQCIPQTFAANHCPGTSNLIYDPVANIAASIGYVRTQYGVAADGSNLASKVQQADASRSPKGY